MHPYVWIPLFACAIAAAIAAGIAARDPEPRVTRLLAWVLVCSAWWSLCEVVLNLGEDPERVVWIVRLSSLGWMWMGPICLDIYAEISHETRSLARRLVPWSYGAAIAGIAMYLTTPWGVARVVPAGWGWGFVFGPLFPLAFLPTTLCVGFVLWHWPRFFASGASQVERQLAVGLFAGILLSMTVATTTDVLFPYLGLHVPRLGSTSLLLLGSVVAWSVSRHGYFLLAPGAFAREILDALSDGVALLRTDGRLRSWNAAFASLAGRPPRALAGTGIAELLPSLADWGPVEEPRDLETRLVDARGERIPVAVSARDLRDERGAPVGRVLAIRDLREVAALRSRLVTSGRLAAVGELAAGIAHEINNPVTFVRANLIELRRRWGALAGEAEPGDRVLREEGEELIDESLEGVDRVAGIVRDVRSFAHAGLGEAELCSVNELVENAANVAALRYAVTVERCYGDVPPVRCAPQQLRQVFLNLIVNALHAVGESGRIRLVTQRLRDAVIVRIEDDGCGIPEAEIERVFDPFFTTRPVGEGTGLGLALCYQIVRNHGGDITVESESGRGTSVRVHLPAVPLGA